MKFTAPNNNLKSIIQELFSSSKSTILRVMDKVETTLIGGKPDNKKRKLTWKHKQAYDTDEVSDTKKPKLEEKEWPFRKKKVAMLLVYSGKGYLGMQRNPGFKTIESDFLDALVKSEVVRPDHIEQPGAKMAFQRAARTDKGVSAAGQVVSFKMFIDVEDAINKINLNLPDQIRALGLKKVTKTFDCKNSCSARTYIYMAPTFAFAPINETVTESYRITDDVLKNIQDILTCFCGTRNFHNYTSGKKSSDPSANRYIMDFKVGNPFLIGDMEYVVLTVKGQSFMLHQIRKMTGVTMAICRGYTTIDILKRSWMADKIDIPKAPGLGLVLNQLHYDGYNRKFGKDGVHEALEWKEFEEQINSFKEKFIFSTIYKTEKEEKSMMKWLSTLAFHHYDIITDNAPGTWPLLDACKKIKEAEENSKVAQISKEEDQADTLERCVAPQVDSNIKEESVEIIQTKSHSDLEDITLEKQLKTQAENQ